MRTDSFFYRFFREFIEAFFTLIGEDEQKAKSYVRAIAFRRKKIPALPRGR
ncbi:MAG: DUF2887 domain-containing protein [bacterium]